MMYLADNYNEHNISHGLLNYTVFQLDSTVNYRRLKTELEVFQYDDKNVIKTPAVYLILKLSL